MKTLQTINELKAAIVILNDVILDQFPAKVTFAQCQIVRRAYMSLNTMRVTKQQSLIKEATPDNFEKEQRASHEATESVAAVLNLNILHSLLHNARAETAFYHCMSSIKLNSKAPLQLENIKLHELLPFIKGATERVLKERDEFKEFGFYVLGAFLKELESCVIDSTLDSRLKKVSKALSDQILAEDR